MLDITPEVYWITNVELSLQYEEKFSKDDFQFGSNNFHFKIYIYNLTPFSSVSVSSKVVSSYACQNQYECNTPFRN